MAGKFKLKKGYSRINLLSRENKDKIALSTAEKNAGAGMGPQSVIIKSNKSEHPKGSKVTFTKISKTSKDKTTKAVDYAKPNIVIGKIAKTGYQKADNRYVAEGAKSYGKESLSKETPGFVKDAQAKEKDIVMKDGKPFRAGYTTFKKEDDKVSFGKKDVKIPGITTSEVNVGVKKNADVPTRMKGDVQTTKGGKVSWLPKSKVKRGHNKYKVKITSK